jgi:hypothetical protein
MGSTSCAWTAKAIKIARSVLINRFISLFLFGYWLWAIGYWLLVMGYMILLTSDGIRQSPRGDWRMPSDVALS